MKKFLSSILAMLVVSLSLPYVAWAETAEPVSGYCGISSENGGIYVEYVITDTDADGNFDKITFRLSAEAGTDNVSSAAMMDYIGYGARPWNSYKNNIKTVEIQQGVTNICNYAFYEFSSLTSVDIPDSVTSIGNYAFNFCSSLESIDIPEDVTSIGQTAFSGCSKLKSIDIPSNINSISNSTFSGCSSLESIDIPDNVTSIGQYAFAGCSDLDNITIPDSVTNIGQDAFKNCAALTNVSYLGTADLYNEGEATNNKEIFTGTTPEGLTITVPCNYNGSTFFTKGVSLEPHTFPTEYTDNGENHSRTCTKCGYEETNDHTYAEYSTKTEATCQADKTESATCVCGHEDVRSVSNTRKDHDLYVDFEKHQVLCRNDGCNYVLDIPTIPTYPEEPSEEPENEHPDWGTLEIHAGIKHYVDAEGMTSVEISPENTDENGIVWLREESEGSSAWYGLDNSSGIFEEGSRFYVQWLNESEHSETFENIDDTTVENVDNGNGWLFEVGVTAPDGTPYKQLEKTIDFYVQIGDDWDREDLDAFYISQDEDEQIPVRYDNIGYPSGIGTFGIMKLSHFSPYFIYDKLSDEEKATFDKLTDEQKAALDSAAKELASQQEEKSTTSAESKPETSSSSSAVKTGDETGYIVLMSSAMFIIAGLYLELCMKRKRDQ